MRHILASRWLWLGFAILVAATGCNDKPPEYNQTSGDDGHRKDATRVYLDEEWDDDCDAGDGDNEDWRYVSIRRPGMLHINVEFSSPDGLNANVFVHDKEGRALNGIRTNGVEDTYDLAAMPVRMGRYYLHVVCKAGSSSYTLTTTFEPEPTDERPPVVIYRHPPMKRIPVQESAQRRARDKRAISRADLMRSSGRAGTLPDQVTPKDTRYGEGQKQSQGPRTRGGVAYNDIEMLVWDEGVGRFVPLSESGGLRMGESRVGGGMRAGIHRSLGGAFAHTAEVDSPPGVPARRSPTIGVQPDAPVSPKPPGTQPETPRRDPPRGGSINESGADAENPLGMGTVIIIKPNRRDGALQITLRNVGTALNPTPQGVRFSAEGSTKRGRIVGLPHRQVTLFECEAQRCYGTTDATIDELQRFRKVDFR